MSNTARLTIECTPDLVHRAKLVAAMRRTTMRELITAMIEEAAKAHGITDALPGAIPIVPSSPPPSPTPPSSPPPNKALEDAIVAHMEAENARMEAEHERRIAAGIIKG